MPSTVLLETLKEDYPRLHFSAGDHFAWDPNTNTITFDVSDPLFDARLLHEVSHGELEHQTYDRDIDLIAMERDAWQHAKVTLAPRYGVELNADHIHDDMDTYREWLHARSTCPHCQANGLEVKKHLYRCVACTELWRVNEARACSLRRYSDTTKDSS